MLFNKSLKLFLSLFFSVIFFVGCNQDGFDEEINLERKNLSKSSTPIELRVMSYNVKTVDDNCIDQQRWDQRKGRIARLIKLSAISPDIIGLQEVESGDQNSDLKDSLQTNGDFIRHEGSMQNSSGEFCPIYYNKTRFIQIEHDTFESTFVVSRMSGTYRIANWIILKDNKTNLHYLVINSHFDSEGDRTVAARRIRRAVTDIKNEYSFALYTIVMGDFNQAPETGNSYDAMTIETSSNYAGSTDPFTQTTDICYYNHILKDSNTEYVGKQLVSGNTFKQLPGYYRTTNKRTEDIGKHWVYKNNTPLYETISHTKVWHAMDPKRDAKSGTKRIDYIFYDQLFIDNYNTSVDGFTLITGSKCCLPILGVSCIDDHTGQKMTHTTVYGLDDPGHCLSDHFPVMAIFKIYM